MERQFEWTTPSLKGLIHPHQECTWDVLLLDQDTGEAQETGAEIMTGGGVPALTTDEVTDLAPDHILVVDVSILLADVKDLTLLDGTNLLAATAITYKRDIRQFQL